MAEIESTSLTADTAADAFSSMLAAEAGDNHAEEGEEVPDTEGEDAEPAESEEPDEPEAEEEEEDQPTYTVKIDGKEVAVPVDELIKGYHRNADYTRKTMELAEQRKAAQSDHESAKAERAHYAQQLEAVSSMLQANAPQEPDWDKLVVENPAEYLRQQRIHQLRYQNLQAVEAEQRKLAERNEAEEAKANQERLDSEATKLVEAIPEWKNPKTAKAEKEKLVEFATKAGYGPDELAQINDHRVVMLLRKAMLFDQINATRANLRPAQPQGPKVAQPGSPVSRSGNEFSRAQKRLKQTGDVHDAAAVFMHL